MSLMTIAPYQLLILWWPLFVCVFFTCIVAHMVFYWYLCFWHKLRTKWLQRRNKIVSIRIVPGIPRKS